jgi:hypothetical protein
MAPVDFESLAGTRLHAHIGPWGSVCPHRMQIFLQDTDTTIIAKGTETLSNHDGGDGGVLLQQFGDGWLERVKLAGTLTSGVWLGRSD